MIDNIRILHLLIIGLIILFVSMLTIYIKSQKNELERFKKINEDFKKQIEKERKVEEELIKFSSIIENSNDGIIISSIEGEIFTWNKGAEAIYGYSSKEAIGNNISIIFPPDNVIEIDNLSEVLKNRQIVKNFETKRIRKDGTIVDVAITLSPLKDENGEIITVSGIDRDITQKIKSQNKLKESYEELSAVYGQLSATEEELKQQIVELKNREKALKTSEERYKLAIDGANDAIWECDYVNKSFFISDKWKSISGYDDTDIKDIIDYAKKLIYPEDMKRAKQEFESHIKGEKDYYQSEFRIKIKDGTYKWINNRGKALKDELGNVIKIAGSVTDIDETKRIQNKIRYLAYNDSLTGLPNRIVFMEGLREAITKNKEKKCAVIVVDVDDFKIINDILGHDYGDEVLKNIAFTLKNSLPQNGIMARTSGDEFLILLNDVKDSIDISKLCDKILNNFKFPLIVNDNRIYTSVSMGIAMFPEDAETSKELLRNSDTAMYKAKNSGKNTYNFFNKEMTETIIRKAAIEKYIREAISKEELQIYYQPQIDAKSHRIKGFEALIRWKSVQLGWVSPNEFIPIIEENGMIIDIGKWIIEEVCRQNEEWKKKGYKYETIAINISPIQLHHHNFIEELEQCMANYRIDAKDIEIEITENILMNIHDRNIEVLKRLRDMKFNIALDDFGTGYSSLSYLRVMPINKLKIDKSFIDYIETDNNNRDITEGIIELSHKMGMQVVAEGVENESQLSILKDMNCDSIQGYYFSKPLPKEQAEQFLAYNNECKEHN